MRGWLGWLAFGLICTSIMLPFLFSKAPGWDLRVILIFSGTSYQLIGFIITIISLDSIHGTLFSRSLASRIITYLGDIPIGRRPSVIASGRSISASAIVTSASLDVRISDDADIEEKVSLALQEIKRLQEKSSKLDEDLKAKSAEIKDLRKHVEAEVSRVSIDVREHIREILGANVELEILGICLFMIGIVYATVPEWLVTLASWLQT